MAALGAESSLLTMPELYRRLSGDVNNREKRAAVSATCAKLIGGRRLRGSKGQLEMGDNPAHGLT